MADKKVSILMAAKDQFSKVFESGQKSAGRLQSAVDAAQGSLKSIGDQQKLITRFKDLSVSVSGTSEKMRAAKKAVESLSVAEKESSKVARAHARDLKSAEDAVLSAAHAHGVESDQVKLARLEVDRLTKAKKEADKQSRIGRSELKAARGESERLTTEYGRQSQKLSGLRSEMSGAGLKLNSLGAQELKLARQTKEATQALEAQEARLKRVQSIKGRMADRRAQRGELVGQAVGTAAMMAPMVLAGKRAVEYEGVFADVKKVVNFKDAKEEAQYRTEMMKMSGRLGVSQDGAAEIITAAGQSGIEKDQLLKFAEAATKMSVAWDVEAGQAGETLATWRAAMGLSQDQAMDLADSTNFLSNNMNAKAKDIAAVMVRQGSTAMQAGLSANQTAALSASLIAGGATEETASTALKNITGRLTAGYAATSSQSDAMARIGFDPEQLAAMMQQDATGTLVEVMRSLQGVDKKDQGAVISQLFGEEVKGAVAKLVGTLDDPSNGLVSAFAKVSDASLRAGSVEQEYAQRAATRGNLLAKMSSKFDRMTIVLGDRLLPVLDTVLPPMMSAVDAISDFAENSPGVATGLIAVAGGLAVLKAGAIAFKLLKLTAGNLGDRGRLVKERLGGVTGKTAVNADRATSALGRLNRQLSRMGGRGAGGAGVRSGAGARSGYGAASRRWDSARVSRRPRGRFGRMAGGILSGGRSLLSMVMPSMFSGAMDYPDAAAPARSSRGRPRGRLGKFGRMAGMLGSGAALSMFSGAANAGDMAMAGADMAGALGGISEALPMLKGLGKLFRPMDIMLQGAGLFSAVKGGDSKEIGGTAGDMVGGLGGAAAGGMAGAAIGSVVPIIGTAIGGIAGSIIGGMGGGELGGWLGEKVGGWFSEDKTEQPAPSSVAKQAEKIQSVSRSNAMANTVHFSPTVQVSPSGNPSYDKQVGDSLIDRLKAEFMGYFSDDSSLAALSDASLSDGGNV